VKEAAFLPDRQKELFGQTRLRIRHKSPAMDVNQILAIIVSLSNFHYHLHAVLCLFYTSEAQYDNL
jgi:hypothetical protein